MAARDRCDRGWLLDTLSVSVMRDGTRRGSYIRSLLSHPRHQDILTHVVGEAVQSVLDAGGRPRGARPGRHLSWAVRTGDAAWPPRLEGPPGDPDIEDPVGSAADVLPPTPLFSYPMRPENAICASGWRSSLGSSTPRRSRTASSSMSSQASSGTPAPFP